MFPPLRWSVLLPLVNACAPFISSAPPRRTMMTMFTTTTSTVTPPAPMNADYYDDISLPLTNIEIPKMTTTMDRGSMVVIKPPLPKPPLLKPMFLRDMRPLPPEKLAKTFQSFFDIWKPAPLPSFPPIKNIFAPKESALPFPGAPRLQSPFSRNTVLSFKASPPISWTYCEPMCGVGDQAVDPESALDNAELDIKEGLAQSFSILQLPPVRSEDVNVTYLAKSTQLEDYGNSYDFMGYRYVTIGSAVAFRRHKTEPSKNGEFFVEVKVKIQHNNINSGLMKQVANKLARFLQLKKGARISGDIDVIFE